ncbi:caffeoylshikimate esterase-like [Argentina anserina]|uniref:caffeoylshikimate esterase-like n=1 Tax=Argentina anserina TaxID=57926 RepID=UPI00217692F4|nr:caffeoylshikimate esterase-like [Potentilla anserina]
MTGANLSPTLRSPEASLFHLRYRSLIKQKVPSSLFYPKLQFKTRFRVTARKWSSPMEGLSQEMNTIASQNLDHAPARRRVRSAFIDVHKQLDHCLFKMDHAGVRTEEWYGRNSRGMEIFCKSWLPKSGDQIKAALCFCHGYGSTCTFFFEGIARRIAQSGYAVYAVDYPGFGLSEGLHGYISDFDELVNDVIEQFTSIKGRSEVKDLPFFVMGESMGGAVALKIHLKEPQKWDGVILVAPMCKIADDVMPPAIVLKLLAFMSEVLPEAKLFPQKDIAHLSYRQSEKRKTAGYNVISYKDQMRSKTAVELLKATKDIETHLDKVSSPLLILHGEADKVTDPAVSRLLYEKASSKDKTLKVYQDGYHCILQGEPDDTIFTVLNDIVTWLNSRCFPN